jgi:hypothetical protein
MKKLIKKLLGYNLGITYNPIKQRYEVNNG